MIIVLPMIGFENRFRENIMIMSNVIFWTVPNKKGLEGGGFMDALRQPFFHHGKWDTKRKIRSFSGIETR